MTTPESGGGNAAPQPRPRPARKTRAGLAVLVAAILIVLAGGGAAYYYFLYLPATPKAVLTEYLALEQKNDYDGTYRFLSERSRKFYSPEKWKADQALQTQMMAQWKITAEHTVIGEPKRSGDTCRIPVTTKTTMAVAVPGSTDGPTTETATLPYILVKEKTGWKIAFIEQIIEQSVEAMRQKGVSDEEIEQTRKALEEMFKEPPPEGQP